jgi:Holliday junction resolvase RusA-like endonuclease
VIQFRVDGKPVPQGSMSAVNGHIFHSQGSALATWRASIAIAARYAGAKPSAQPISMTMVFIFQKPKTVTRSEPTVPPDLDKLIRAVLDGLTAVAYKDDAQVTEIRAIKIYGDRPGVEIQIVEK